MRQRPGGFTLIEILIVIALIGILTAIAMPRFGTAQNTGQAAKCKANIQSIEMALETYYSENGSYPASGDIGALVNAGYLKLAPSCTKEDGSDLGQYFWNTDPNATAPFTFQDPSDASLPGASTTLSYGAGRVFCNYHGTLNSGDWHPDGPPAPVGGGSGGIGAGG